MKTRGKRDPPGPRSSWSLTSWSLFIGCLHVQSHETLMTTLSNSLLIFPFYKTGNWGPERWHRSVISSNSLAFKFRSAEREKGHTLPEMKGDRLQARGTETKDRKHDKVAFWFWVWLLQPEGLGKIFPLCGFEQVMSPLWASVFSFSQKERSLQTPAMGLFWVRQLTTQVKSLE